MVVSKRFCVWRGSPTCRGWAFSLNNTSPKGGAALCWELSTFFLSSIEAFFSFASIFESLRILRSSSLYLSSTTSIFIGLLIWPPFLEYLCAYLGLLLSSYKYLKFLSSLFGAGLECGLLNSKRNELLFLLALASFSLYRKTQNKLTFQPFFCC